VAVRGKRGISVARPGELVALASALWQRFKKDPMYHSHTTHGRNAWVGDSAIKASGVNMPNITAAGLEKLYDKMLSCSGCALKCGHYYHLKSGRYQGSRGHGIEGNVQMWGVTHFKADDGAFLCHVNSLCDRLGVNVDMPAHAYAWAVRLYEEGIITKEDTDGIEFTWGNQEAILNALDKMINRQGFGEIMDGYPLKAAQKLGRGSDVYASHIKGQYAGGSGIMSTIKGTLAHGVATRGHDHLTGNPTVETPGRREEISDEILEKLGRERYNDPNFYLDSPWSYQAKYSLRVYEHENMYSVRDMTGTCGSVSHSPLLVEGVAMQDYARLVSVVTGVDFSAEDLVKAGEREMALERCYNAREGIRRIDDYPHTFWWQLKHSQPHPKYGPPKLSLEDYDLLLDEYYRLRGCDRQTGIPTSAKLEELGLGDIAADLEKRGINAGGRNPAK